VDGIGSEKEVSCTLLAIGALVLTASVARAEVQELDLPMLVLEADRIVVGRVVRIHEINAPMRPRVAEVEVLRHVAGPEGRRLFVLASGTWARDESHAVAGERALLFLRTDRDWDRPPGRLPPWKSDPAFLRRVETLRDGAPFLRIAWWGRGRMPIRRLGPDELVSTGFEPLRVPHSIPSVVRSVSPHGVVRDLPLDALIAHVESLARVPDEGPLREFLTGNTAARIRVLEDATRKGTGTTAMAAAALARLDRSRPRVQMVADRVYDLGGVPPGDLFQLRRHPLSAVREAAARVLADREVQTLYPQVIREDRAARCLAVMAYQAMARRGRLFGFRSVSWALADEDEGIRARAAHVLGTLAAGKGELGKIAGSALVGLSRSQSADVRRVCLLAMATWSSRGIRRTGDASRLTEGLYHEDVWIQRIAAEGLANLVSRDFDAFLDSRADHSACLVRDPIVRRLLDEAHRRIRGPMPATRALEAEKNRLIARDAIRRRK
jgi:hypothetical protein